jgi:signal transduction histidine kinase
MENKIEKICAEGLSLFGKTNRLISHELKNILAIISETLGLMDELMKLSKNGEPLKPEKLRSLGESMMEEVDRANKIIRNMNAFAHSVDEIIGKVDIGQTMELMIEFCRLDSDVRRTTFHLTDHEPCVIHTSHFFLANLIYNLLIFSSRGVGPTNEIRISFASDDHEARITFSGIAKRIIGEFPTEKEAWIAKALSGQLTFNNAVGELNIVLPVQFNRGPIQGLILDT